MAKKGKYSIEIYKSWCKRCGICAAFCPAGVLAQEESGDPYVADPERCTGCQLCQLRCPDFAINVHSSPKKGERKTADKDGKTANE